MSAGSRRGGGKFGLFGAGRGRRGYGYGLDLTGPLGPVSGDGETHRSTAHGGTPEFAGQGETVEFTGHGETGESAGDAREPGDGFAARALPSADREPERYAPRHAAPRRKTAWKRAGVVAPVAAVAATLAAGAAAYGIVGNGHVQASQLPASIGLPGRLAATVHPGAGTATAAAAMITVGQATVSHAERAAAPSPSGSRATPAATATGSAGGRVRASATPAASTATSPSPSATPTATTFSCNLSGGMLPDNVTAIVNFFIQNGYTHNAAAGIAGNIYQESKGNPESAGMGGGGLIGWTPLPSGFVTGNPTADLRTQLAAILTYNQGWASYLPALNSAASPADAAYIYVTDFERAGIPAASTREAAAQAVAAACGL